MPLNMPVPSIYLPRAGSPRSMNGAQYTGRDHSGCSGSSIRESIARRRAYAALSLPEANCSKDRDIRTTADWLSTGQCETTSDLAPAYIKARAKPDSASLPEFCPAAVLQADKTTQSASNFNCATSEAVRTPSSSSVGLFGLLKISDGSTSNLDAEAISPETIA